MNFGSFGLGSSRAQISSVMSGIKSVKSVGPSQLVSALDPERFFREQANSSKPTPNPKANVLMRNRLQKLMMREDPVLSYQWVGSIHDPTSASQLPSEYIDGITTAAITVEAQQQNFNGTTKKSAGAFSVDSITVKLYTDIKAVSFNYADTWMRSTYRTDGFYNLPSKYKRDVQLYVLDATNQTVIDITFVGCFPTSYDAYSMGADSGLLETNLTLSVDECYFSFDTDFSTARQNVSDTYNLNAAKSPGSRLSATLGSMNIPGVRDRLGF